MLSKPPHGAPCNGCGQCCAAMRCPLAVHVFGEGGRCPALETRLPRFTCGLVARPETYAPAIVARHGKEAAAAAAARLIGAGLGCDALLEGEQPDHAWRARVKRSIDPQESARARAIWRYV